MTRWLRKGHRITGSAVQRLMRLMGRWRRSTRSPTSPRANAAHRVYPYLLRDLVVDRPNQIVWATDITYVPIQGGHIYLCAVLDWYSRYVLAWELSNTLDATFCVAAVQRALARYGPPEHLQHRSGLPVYLRRVYRAALARDIKLSMTAKAGASTTSSSSGCGAASNTRKST